MTTPLGTVAVERREERRVSVSRTTRETEVTVAVDLDGDGVTAI